MISAIEDNRLTRWWGRVTAGYEIAHRPAPWRMSPRLWGRIFARSVAAAVRDDFGIVASSIAFAAFLSVMPLVSLIILIYGFVATPEAVSHTITTLVAILPGSAQQLVRTWLTNSLTRHDGSIFALLFSGAITLFSAVRAGQSLLHGIRVASDIRQDRGPLAQVVVAMIVVVAGAGLLLAALLSVSALTLIEALVPNGLPGAKLAFTVLLWSSLTLAPATALVFIYRYTAGRDRVPWVWTVPGTLIAVALWIGATLVFRLYVSQLARYDSTYGSLSAVVVLLLWLMLSAYAVLFGAKINAEAMRAADVARVSDERDPETVGA